MKQSMTDIAAGKVYTVVVYKVDRLRRSLADFAKIRELFDSRQVSFVSVTQQFNRTTSMGRLRRCGSGIEMGNGADSGLLLFCERQVGCYL